MATGDADDMLRRLKALVPDWFSSSTLTPVLDGVLAGVGAALGHAYDLRTYAHLQIRIKTATDGWLDLIAYDYFGLRFQRRVDQTDESFRVSILEEILRVRGTRAGVIKAITDLTGRVPFYFEPANPFDTGGIGVASSMGWSMAGRWGSLMLPHQAFVQPYRPMGSAIPNVNGLSGYLGGYGVGAGMWSSPTFVDAAVTDQDILDTIERTKPAGTILWTSIQANPVEDRLDDDFLTDGSFSL